MRLLLSILVVAFPLSLSAAKADDCANAQTQADIDQCIGKSFQESDKKLNQSYKQIEARLKGDAASTKLLVSAQRAWVAFRDAECSFQAGPIEGAGTMYPATLAGCKGALTQKRLEDFKGYLNCQEGDTSCPVPAAQ